MSEKQWGETEDLKTIEEGIASYMKQREKALWRCQIPENRSLRDSLALLTKNELEDVRRCIRAAGLSGLKKHDLAQALVEPLTAFAEMWFKTITNEQYEIFQKLKQGRGVCKSLPTDDTRYDYMRSIGMLFSAKAGDEPCWFMAEELLLLFCRLDTPELTAVVQKNEEITRLATGHLFFYGTLDYEALYESVRLLTKADIPDLPAFIGLLFNASCWQGLIEMADTAARYYGVLDLDVLEMQQSQHKEYKPYDYESFYAAGSAEYTPQEEVFSALLSFLEKEVAMQEAEARQLVMELCIMVLNSEALEEILEYWQTIVDFPSLPAAQAAVGYLIGLYNHLPRWAYKGFSLKELQQAETAPSLVLSRENKVKMQAVKSQVGRNDPCPCGSGKKYKKCCL